MKEGRRPVTPVNVLEIIVLVALPVILHFIVPVFILVPSPYRYTGILIMAGGFYLMLKTSGEFRKKRTSYELHGESFVLITSGPFRYSRNPMYLGILIWLIGLAVLLGSLVACIFPVLFFLLAQGIMIPMEEKKMLRAAGAPYSDYMRHVRRWL
jgi:protein-S-isoprenylcysteine O-methyltransferase Ste14